jgi:hypothetical protein
VVAVEHVHAALGERRRHLRGAVGVPVVVPEHRQHWDVHAAR